MATTSTSTSTPVLGQQDNSEFVSRLSSLPYVNKAVDSFCSAYDKYARHSCIPIVQQAVVTIESHTAELAKPVLRSDAFNKIDSLACTGLDQIQSTVKKVEASVSDAASSACDFADNTVAQLLPEEDDATNMEKMSDDISKAAEHAADGASDAIDDAVEKVNDADAALGDEAKKALNKIRSVSNKVKTRVHKRALSQMNNLSTRSSEAVDSLKQFSVNLLDYAATFTEDLEDDLEEGYDDAADYFEEKRSEAAKRIGDLRDYVEEGVNDLRRTASGQLEDFADNLADGAQDAKQKLKNKTDDFADDMTEDAQDTKKNLQNKTQDAKKKLKNKTKDAKKKLKNKTADLADRAADGLDTAKNAAQRQSSKLRPKKQTPRSHLQSVKRLVKRAANTVIKSTKQTIETADDVRKGQVTVTELATQAKDYTMDNVVTPTVDFANSIPIVRETGLLVVAIAQDTVDLLQPYLPQTILDWLPKTLVEAKTHKLD